MTNKLVFLVLALIPFLVLTPSFVQLSFAAPDCVNPETSPGPGHYNITCEGINATQFDETIAALQHALNGTLPDEVK